MPGDAGGRDVTAVAVAALIAVVVLATVRSEDGHRYRIPNRTLLENVVRTGREPED